MIELTRSQGVIRDLRDWESKEPRFLTDVVDGKLHYYFSAKHEGTNRFKEGKNPPIFSVIRYLTKAFQYGLELRETDLERVQEIIDDFSPGSVHAGYIKEWLEKNAPKLVRHAVDVEYAWNTLEKMGLRKKLIATSDPNKKDTLGWWLNKEPMRTFTVGQGEGRTIARFAQDRRIDPNQIVFAHETSDFLAYESLTRNTTGLPNVFISRRGAVGETAAAGEGHYTQIGRVGARGTGLTIRYRPNLNAREGTDFTVHFDYVVWLNRDALRVIPESLNFGIPEYLEFLASGQAPEVSDLGIYKKLERRIQKQFRLFRFQDLDPNVFERLVSLVSDELEKPKPNFKIVETWISLPGSEKYPFIISKLAKTIAAQNKNPGDLKYATDEKFWRRLLQFMASPSLLFVDHLKYEYQEFLANRGVPWGFRYELFREFERQKVNWLRYARDAFIEATLLDVGELLAKGTQNIFQNPFPNFLKILKLRKMGVENPLIGNEILVLFAKHVLLGSDSFSFPYIPYETALGTNVRPVQTKRLVTLLAKLVRLKDRVGTSDHAIGALKEIAYHEANDLLSSQAFEALRGLGDVAIDKKLLKQTLKADIKRQDTVYYPDSLRRNDRWKTFVTLGASYRDTFEQAMVELLHEDGGITKASPDIDEFRFAVGAIGVALFVGFECESLDHTAEFAVEQMALLDPAGGRDSKAPSVSDYHFAHRFEISRQAKEYLKRRSKTCSSLLQNS
jgi:hypothetical protein